MRCMRLRTAGTKVLLRVHRSQCGTVGWHPRSQISLWNLLKRCVGRPTSAVTTLMHEGPTAATGERTRKRRNRMRSSGRRIAEDSHAGVRGGDRQEVDQRRVPGTRGEKGRSLGMWSAEKDIARNRKSRLTSTSSLPLLDCTTRVMRIQFHDWLDVHLYSTIKSSNWGPPASSIRE